MWAVLLVQFYFNDEIITGSRFHGGDDRLRYGFFLNISQYYIITQIIIKIIEFYNFILERSFSYNMYFQEFNIGKIIQLFFSFWF